MARLTANLKAMFLLIVIFMYSDNLFSQETEVLSLNDCIKIAMGKNSTLKISRMTNESADKDVLGSYSGILPSISASANTGKSESGPREYLGDAPVGIDTTTGNVIYQQRLITSERTSRKFNSAGLTLNQNIFDGGVWWNNIRKAKTDRLSAEYGLEADQNDIILQVEQAFFDLNKQEKLLEVDELAVSRSQAQLDRTEKMYELGATAQLDVFQARVNLGNDRIALLQQENAVGQAKKNLNLVMGRDPFTPIKVSSKLELEPGLPESQELINSALENQPGIMQNEADIKSRDLSVSLAKGIFYPNFYGYVDYRRSNEDLNRVYSNYDKNYSVSYGFGVSLNIFNGFNDYVRVQKAKIAKRSAEENFEAYKRNLASEVEQYYANYKSYQDIIEINRHNLDAAKEEVRLAEERYQIGAGTFLEVREAQVNLTRAEQTLIAAQFNARIVLAQLDNALGTSYSNFATGSAQ